MRRTLLLPLLAALAAPACGDDADSNGSASGSDVERYCELNAELDEGSEVFLEGVDFGDPDSVAAAYSQFVDDNAAQLEEIVEVAPEEIKGDVEELVGALEAVAETGDTALFDGAAEADANLQEFEDANC